MEPRPASTWQPLFRHPADESPSVAFSDLGRTWNDTVTRLIEAGFTFHDAVLWEIAREPGRDNDVLATHAALYRDVGFTATEAVEWFCNGINPIDAVAYASHGWEPAQARMLRRLLHEADHTSLPDRWTGPYTESHVTETWWLLIGAPPMRVLRYVLAGCTDREARTLEHRHQQGDDTVDAAIEFLAALRSPRPIAT